MNDLESEPNMRTLVPSFFGQPDVTEVEGKRHLSTTRQAIWVHGFTNRPERRIALFIGVKSSDVTSYENHGTAN